MTTFPIQPLSTAIETDRAYRPRLSSITLTNHLYSLAWTFAIVGPCLALDGFESYPEAWYFDR